MNHFLELKSPRNETVQANYNKLSDHIRRLTPQGIQCSVFCGGEKCKYENPENWKPDSLAIQGIYSHWITEDILAMARPSTLTIIKKNVIQQFESLGIKSIINLQSPGEHASCGQPLESSGFSYNPNVFMEHNVYYYNFTWKDYGEATLEGLVNMIKVLAFAVSEGKVAIHCHAGLGRTGVLVACYLVYSLRVTANDAIRYLRLRRPGSVQTRGQILCVRHFAQFILPQTVIFFIRDALGKDKYMNEFTLHRYLRRQRIVLHGYDERNFKYIPKTISIDVRWDWMCREGMANRLVHPIVETFHQWIFTASGEELILYYLPSEAMIVHVICERILKLCGCWVNDFPPSTIPFTVDFFSAKLHSKVKTRESTYSLNSLCSGNSEAVFLTSDLKSPSSRDLLSSPDLDDSTDAFSDIGTFDDEELNEDAVLENRCFRELEIQKSLLQEVESEVAVQSVDVAVDALLADTTALDFGTRKKIRQYQQDINSSQLGWTKLNLENDLYILSALLFEWIEGLKLPVLGMTSFETIVVLYKQPENCMRKIAEEECYFIEYLLRFLAKFQPISEDNVDYLLRRFIGALSKHYVPIKNKMVPLGKGFKKMGEGSSSCAFQLFKSLLLLVDQHHIQKPDAYNDGDTESGNE